VVRSPHNSIMNTVSEYRSPPPYRTSRSFALQEFLRMEIVVSPEIINLLLFKTAVLLAVYSSSNWNVNSVEFLQFVAIDAKHEIVLLFALISLFIYM
jgi:hypothetical protein